MNTSIKSSIIKQMLTKIKDVWRDHTKSSSKKILTINHSIGNSKPNKPEKKTLFCSVLRTLPRLLHFLLHKCVYIYIHTYICAQINLSLEKRFNGKQKHQN